MEHAIATVVDNLKKSTICFKFQCNKIQNLKIGLILTFTDSRSPLSSTHLKNFPPKNCTPMIENINQNTRQTSSTLKIDGIAYIRAFTTIYN